MSTIPAGGVANTDTATITGTSQGTDWLKSRGNDMNVDITGFGVATIQLQKRFTDATGTEYVVKSYDASSDSWNDVIATHDVGAEFRLQCTAYTSGTITARLTF